MIRPSSSVRPWALLLVCIGVWGPLTGGCDTSGSKQESLYQQLAGSWRINTIALDGRAPTPLRDTVRIDFSAANDVRSYRIIQAASSDTTRMGRIDIPQDNILRMGGFSSPLVWKFEFDGSLSVQFRLSRAGEKSVRDFLAAIGESGGANTLTLELLRDSG